MQKRTIPVSVNPDKVITELKKVDDPDIWSARMLDTHRRLPLFVSPPYDRQDREVDPQTGIGTSELLDPYTNDPKGMIHPPVSNAWLLEHNLDILAQNVLDQDPDGDGFTNLDEYNGHTDPNDREVASLRTTRSSCSRASCAFLSGCVLTQAGTGPFQINTVDMDQPTQFLKIGDMVKGTKFKLTKFEKKSRMDSGMNRDISEVTLVNIETNEPIVLPKQEEVDSPTTYAVLTYLWTGKPFAVKKNQEFTLKPEDNVKYKCVDLSDTEVKVDQGRREQGTAHQDADEVRKISAFAAAFPANGAATGHTTGSLDRAGRKNARARPERPRPRRRAGKPSGHRTRAASGNARRTGGIPLEKKCFFAMDAARFFALHTVLPWTTRAGKTPRPRFGLPLSKFVPIPVPPALSTLPMIRLRPSSPLFRAALAGSLLPCLVSRCPGPTQRPHHHRDHRFPATRAGLWPRKTTSTPATRT